MIFKRGRKRDSESRTEELAEDAALDEVGEPGDAADDALTAIDEPTEEPEEVTDLDALEDLDWRSSGPYDISEVDSIESTEENPKIDLGSLILTPVPGSELRLQVAEETGEIVSAMLVIETIVEPPASANKQPQAYSSALELGAYAAPRSGGLWAELRDEISRNATEAGGTASLGQVVDADPAVEACLVLGELLERRALHGPAGERVLQHPQVKPGLPRLRPQLCGALDVQAAVLRDDDGLGALQLGRDFGDHRLLLLQTKTQGLPPCCVTRRTWNQERRLRRAIRV